MRRFIFLSLCSLLSASAFDVYSFVFLNAIKISVLPSTERTFVLVLVIVISHFHSIFEFDSFSMDRLRAPSQISLDRRTNSNKDINTLSTGKQTQLQNELDQFLEDVILEPMLAYDPKLDFTKVPIVTRDQVLKQTRRQSYGLIWNPIRSSQYSRLVREDRCCAFVQILRSPPEWSRYDADLFLMKIRQKTFLNGFTLRDEFFRVLQLILKRDFSDERHSKAQRYPFELKDVDFTRNMIQLVLTGRPDTDLYQLTLVLSLTLLIEFDLPPMEFFPETTKTICAHADFQEYFFGDPDGHRTRVTPFSSIKFIFDYSSTEANVCDFILAKEGSLSVMLKGFLKLRKEWLKYTQRAAKHATDTIKMQIQTDRQRQSTCSVHSVRSGASNASLMNSK